VSAESVSGNKTDSPQGQIWEQLSRVIDPETGLDVVRMELIREVRVEEDGSAAITFRPSSPVCPLAFQLGYEIREAAKSVTGVQKVKVKVENFVYAEQLEETLTEAEGVKSAREGDK
jgi:metal-sulfur cluster biosynthetic enzyme